MNFEKRIERGFRWFVRHAPRKTPGWLPSWLGRRRNDEVNAITRRLLDDLAAIERIDTLRIDEGRRQFESLSARLPQGPENVAEKQIRLRGVAATLFTPENLRHPSECLVYVHGGGFVLGSVQAFAPVCRTLAFDLSMPVISLEYGLAPELRFPGQTHQVGQAIHGLLDSDVVAELKLKTDLGYHVAGDSAGANLAAAALIEDRTLQPLSLVAIYPWMDLRLSSDQESLVKFGTGHFLSLSALRWFREQYLVTSGVGETTRASPYLGTDSDLRGLPPTLTIIAECDPLRDQARAFAFRLRSIRERDQSVEYRGMPHGFMLWPGVISHSNEAVKRIASFFEALRD